MGLKILHTADWHLGQKFYDYDRINEHTEFLKWLINILSVESIDVLLIAGDIFDIANPSSQTQRLFYNFLYEATQQIPGLQIVLIAGNHDSAARLEAPSILMEAFNISVIGNIKRTESGKNLDLQSLILPLKAKNANEISALCLAVPFLRNGDLDLLDSTAENYTEKIKNFYQSLYQEAEKNNPSQLPIIAMGHLHTAHALLSDSERGIRGGLEVVDLESFNPNIAYVALGHIHKSQKIGNTDHIRYAGSPIPMSFSEANYKHQVIVLELIPDQSLQIKSIEIPKKVELKRIGSPLHPLAKEHLFEVLKQLPKLTDDLKQENAPYLEINVFLEGPDLLINQEIKEILADKYVRLARNVAYYPSDKDNQNISIQNIEELKEISPIELLQNHYQNKYGKTVPDELTVLFNQVVTELTQED